ncbi:MAG TPA: Ig-like domain-containing protein, partial [Candidatus Acidoferrum sp.]|nr:Ig-like domain-containing protein [Candidatus Acidoferrum sp.]
NSYTVKWVVEGAETQEVYLYNATPSYKGEPPVKPATAEFTYTFSGWAPELAAVTGPATYTAQFSSSTNAYTVTWVDGNGEEIYTEQVPYGETPEYDFGHGTPGKDSTAQYHYTFSGWLPPVGEIGGEVTYVAQFTPVLRSYTISWDTDGDSDVDDTTTVFFGELPAHDDGVKPADDENFYDFAGWFPSIVTVTDEATYTATFTTVPRTWTVKVDPVDFGTINKGELSATPPKYIVITNEGNSPAAILSVTVDAGDAEVAFEIGGPADGAIVPAEGTLNDTYSIQPKDDLTPGTYTQTITVTFEGGEVLTAMASVTIGINDPVPVAVDDLYTAQMNGLLEGNVLTNDTDVNGDTLTAILVGEPAHGALVLNADGTFTYEPALNFVGEDSFTYKANDGRSDSNEATVSITVSAEPYTTLVGPDPAVIRIGNTFEVKYYLHNVLNVSAQDVTLSYDPAVFEFMGLAAEGPADQVFAVFDDDEETGKVKVILANVVPMIGDGNLIFTATFKAVGVMASSEIALTKAEVASADAPSVILNPALSSLTVGTADPSELAALIDSAQDTHDDASEGTASGEYPKGAKKALQSAINAAQGVLDNMASTQAQLDAAKDALRNALSAFRALEREIMAGDFNNNGRLDIGDLSVFITHYGEVGDDAYDYDMNNDGVVDTEDLTILMLLILG